VHFDDNNKKKNAIRTCSYVSPGAMENSKLRSSRYKMFVCWASALFYYQKKKCLFVGLF